MVDCVEPQRAICAGQVAAFYREDECLGSAIIAGNDHVGQRGDYTEVGGDENRQSVT